MKNRDFFAPAIELRRSPFSSLVTFKYSVDGSFVDVDSSLYYVLIEQDYSRIILKENESYPQNGDDILNMIEIVFFAGYGNPFPTPKYSDIQIAILNHIAALYENRGDCDTASIAKTLPATSRSIYDSYRIIEISDAV